MADIGRPIRRIEFEPLTTPAPIEEPAAPLPTPEPAQEPETVPA